MGRSLHSPVSLEPRRRPARLPLSIRRLRRGHATTSCSCPRCALRRPFKLSQVPPLGILSSGFFSATPRGVRFPRPAQKAAPESGCPSKLLSFVWQTPSTTPRARKYRIKVSGYVSVNPIVRSKHLSTNPRKTDATPYLCTLVLPSSIACDRLPRCASIFRFRVRAGPPANSGPHQRCLSVPRRRLGWEYICRRGPAIRHDEGWAGYGRLRRTRIQVRLHERRSHPGFQPPAP